MLADPWPAALDVLRRHGLTILAATPQPGATALRDVETPPAWAALFGAEGPGLSAGALAAADLRVRIPMAEAVDSLNVATAAAVVFAQLT